MIKRTYPRVRINDIKYINKAIIINATSFQNLGKSTFDYMAVGKNNLPHTINLIRSRKLECGKEYSLLTIFNNNEWIWYPSELTTFN